MVVMLPVENKAVWSEGRGAELLFDTGIFDLALKM